jgi:hypothetical protein
MRFTKDEEGVIGQMVQERCARLGEIKLLKQEAEFAGGRESGVGERFGGGLGMRVKESERLEIIAEELEAYWPWAGRGVDVEDAAAHGEFAFLGHAGFRFVALSFEPVRKVARVALGGLCKVAGAIGQVALR